jgi:hypothetical protein
MAALLFFHIEPKLGYNLSELAGFTLGCRSFCMLWESAATQLMLAALG